jgi:acetoacetyl-CoA synthetase
MQALGIRPRDRVAGFLGNHSNTVVAMLATTYLGAIWTAVSPDTGVAAVLDRLVQIEPVLLFADNGVGYNGRTHSSTEKTREIARALKQLKAVVVFQTVPGKIDISNFQVAHGKAWTHEGFLKRYVEMNYISSLSRKKDTRHTEIYIQCSTSRWPRSQIHASPVLTRPPGLHPLQLRNDRKTQMHRALRSRHTHPAQERARPTRTSQKSPPSYISPTKTKT